MAKANAKKTTATSPASTPPESPSSAKSKTAGAPPSAETKAAASAKTAREKRPTAATSRTEPKPVAVKKRGSLLGSRKPERQSIRCYLCGQRFEVSGRTMSTTCTACHKAIKVEDVQVKSYLPVNDLQTCGQITVTKRGRVAAKKIQSGRGIRCEGTLEGSIETDGMVELGARAAWKGKVLHSRTLTVADGATLNGLVQVPYDPD